MCVYAFGAQSLKGVLEGENRTQRSSRRCFKTLESSDPRENVFSLGEDGDSQLIIPGATVCIGDEGDSQ